MKRVAIAKIIAAHGIKGWVKLRVLSGDATFVKTQVKFWLSESEHDLQCLTVRFCGVQKDVLLMAIDGVNDRTAAEALKGHILFADQAALPPPDDNEYYIDSLIGLKIMWQNQHTGRITAVHNFGAGDLLDITLTDGRNFSLPFRAQWVGKVDIAGGEIHLEDGWQDFIL
jgi:16S rRNA processing protein RimM